MEIKKASVNDIKDILILIQKAKDTIKIKNKLEWPDNYDSRSQVLDDISREDRYIIIENKESIASFSLLQNFPEALLDVGKDKKELLPLTITDFVISEKEKTTKVFEKMLVFSEKLAREKKIDELYFSDVVNCEECEDVLKESGFEKEKIKGKEFASSRFLCYKKEIK